VDTCVAGENTVPLYFTDETVSVAPFSQDSIALLQELTDGEVGYHMPEMDDFTPDSYDEYLTAQILLPVGGEMAKGQVTKHRRDHNGRPIGVRHSNPILDTREYEVQFPDGSTQSYLANVIAENLYSQVDAEGNQYAVMEEVIDHEYDASVMTEEDLKLIANGKKHQTTKGWQLVVAWKDGMTSKVPLWEMRNAYPIQVAEYAVANKIQDAPAFRWWVNDVLQKRTHMVQKLKRSKYWIRTTKYGIELPKTVKEALEIDKRTETTFWKDAIDKEMHNNALAFKFNGNDKVPIGYKEIKCHMIFEVKMVGLVCKARFVAGGHLTDLPKDSVYSSIVTRESVRIMLLVAALNDLDILGADIQNAYLQAETKEKVWSMAGAEFGSNQGRPCIIVRALYGLKSSGARFRDHLSTIIREQGFVNSKADADVWMWKAVKPNGFEYWEYILCYVDDELYY